MLKRINHRKIELSIILAAAFFQVAWLVATGWSGATTDWARLVALGIFCLLSTAVVIIIPETWITPLSNAIFPAGQNPGEAVTARTLAKHRRNWLILLLVGFVLIGGIYVAFQRIWSDEQESFSVGKILAEQGFKAFFDQYPQYLYFARQHPPLMPILYGGMIKLFGASFASMRILALAFCFGVLWLTYSIAKKLFDPVTGLFASVLLFTFPLIPRLGTAAMLDIPMTFFFLLSLWFALRLVDQPGDPDPRRGALSRLLLALGLGVSVALACLIRYTGLLAIPVIILLLLLDKRYWQKGRAVQTIFLLGLAALVFVLLFSVWMISAHRMGLTIPIISQFFPIFLDTESAEFLPVSPQWLLQAEDSRGWILNVLVTRLPTSIGVYHFPAILATFIGVIWVTIRSRQWRPVEIFLVGWIGVVSIIIFLLLPDHRYFMPMFPALAMLIARGLLYRQWLLDQPEDLAGIAGSFSIRYLLLSSLFLLSALALLIDWNRQTQLFITSP